jgi:hypothetical protein
LVPELPVRVATVGVTACPDAVPNSLVPQHVAINAISQS